MPPRGDDARAGTGAVLATLREALGEEEYRHARRSTAISSGSFPRGYAALVEAVG